MDKLRYLDSLGVASWNVSGLHPNRQKHLALLARSRSNRELYALRAWLWFGSEGIIRRKQQEAQTEAARCLTLLTNCVLL
ncbi:hypothetical protein B0919_11130 [Hymenobacter sp. CRA2]|nr:hypothetical protein B0919_11130 [Hymenobacter sp. CRA2]